MVCLAFQNFLVNLKPFGDKGDREISDLLYEKSLEIEPRNVEKPPKFVSVHLVERCLIVTVASVSDSKFSVSLETASEMAEPFTQKPRNQTTSLPEEPSASVVLG